MTSCHDNAAGVILAALEGQKVSPEEEKAFRSYPFAGLTLFSRNIDQKNHAALGELSAHLQKQFATVRPFLLAIDQEGGRVARLGPPFPNEGPALSLASGASDEKACASIEAYAYQVGCELKKYGINTNFAPVVDLHTEPSNTAIGTRCFGETSEEVVLRAGAFQRGLKRAGIFSCLKHFPGQGDARVDTHIGKAVIELDEKTLWERELVPYQRLHPEAHMIMISHCIYPAYSQVEASLSPEIMTALLKKKIGYQGLVVSDDMLMGAMPSDEKVWLNALVDAVRAGCDLLLVCRHIDKACLAAEHLKQEAEKDPLFAARLQDAAQKVATLRDQIV